MTTLYPFPNKRYLVFCFRQNKPENIGKIIPTPNKSPITPPREFILPETWQKDVKLNQTKS